MELGTHDFGHTCLCGGIQTECNVSLCDTAEGASMSFDLVFVKLDLASSNGGRKKIMKEKPSKTHKGFSTVTWDQGWIFSTIHLDLRNILKIKLK